MQTIKQKMIEIIMWITLIPVAMAVNIIAAIVLTMMMAAGNHKRSVRAFIEGMSFVNWCIWTFFACEMEFRKEKGSLPAGPMDPGGF